MSRRTFGVSIVVGLVAAAVAVGIVLAGDGESTRPVALPSAETAASETEQGPAPLRLSGVDPFTGDEVDLADYAGKAVVLNFWASWCPPCREELPALVRFADAHPEAGVIGVNYQDDLEAAGRLRDEVGLGLPTISDPSGALGARLGLQGMPTTFFLDSAHRVVGLIAGGTDFAGFEEGLRLATGAS